MGLSQAMVISNQSCWVHVSHQKDVRQVWHVGWSNAGMPVACDLGVKLKMIRKWPEMIGSNWERSGKVMWPQWHVAWSRDHLLTVWKCQNTHIVSYGAHQCTQSMYQAPSGLDVLKRLSKQPPNPKIADEKMLHTIERLVGGFCVFEKALYEVTFTWRPSMWHCCTHWCDIPFLS